MYNVEFLSEHVKTIKNKLNAEEAKDPEIFEEQLLKEDHFDK